MEDRVKYFADMRTELARVRASKTPEQLARDDEEAALDPHGYAEVRPLCPFCSKPFGDQMIDIYHGASTGYESSGPEAYGHVDITCDGCGKLIYRKETW